MSNTTDTKLPASPPLADAAGSEALAHKIARDIMEAGSGPKPCTRIQFMGGRYKVDEMPQGGFCESALAKCIAESLRRHLPNEKGEQRRR